MYPKNDAEMRKKFEREVLLPLGNQPHLDDPEFIDAMYLSFLEEEAKKTNINDFMTSLQPHSMTVDSEKKSRDNKDETMQRGDNQKSVFQSSQIEGAQNVSSEAQRKACEDLKPNGCGPKGKMVTNVIPNNPGFDFTEACNNHDRKFATLYYGFKRANDEFLEEMLAVPPKEEVSGFTGNVRLVKPDKMAHFYHSWVTGEEGQKAYRTAQRNAYICKYGKEPN